MQRNFADVVNMLWHSIRDTIALTTLLSDLCCLDRERALLSSSTTATSSSPSLPAVNLWFSPLLFRLLTPEELSCALPLPRGHNLSAALLRAVLLPMRAKALNPDVTVQLVDALGYSLDANSGILAMITGEATVTPGPPYFCALKPPHCQAMPQTFNAALPFLCTCHHGVALCSLGLCPLPLNSGGGHAR